MDKNPESGMPTRMITIRVIVDVLIWLTVALPTLYLFLQGVPHERGFFCDEENLNYPYKPDTITTSVLIASGFSVSLVALVLTEVLNSCERKCRRPCQPLVGIMHCVKTYAVFLVGFIMQELVVEVGKNKMGVLRPNFVEVCKPSFNRTLCPGYITQYTCTGSDYGEHTVRDSRKSFPSGHAAFSMYIAVFFCIHIQRRLQIRFSRLLKVFLQAGLVFLAILCGLGRVKDNKHHPSDVIAGFILGSVVAVFVCKTVGREMYNSTDALGVQQLPVHTRDKTCGCCCPGDQTPESEPQTPSPLLPNEYFQRNITDSKISPFPHKSQTLPPLRITAVKTTQGFASN